MQISLQVNGLAGLVCDILVQDDWQIHRVKQKVTAETGIPPMQQRLMFESTILSDTDSVSDLPDQPTLQLSLLVRSEAQARLLQELQKNPLESHNLLEMAPEELRADKEIVLEAVQNNGHALMDASADLKEDKDVVLAAVLQNPHALRYAGKGRQSDRELLAKAAATNHHCLSFAAKSVRADEEWMREISTSNSLVWQYFIQPANDVSNL
eukprot:TRINITY_DN41689_c0_g1_i1.p1 TRINITY_DN41689_c0_g1~~TRINITY_DN41689_c0_g1_i1.p1  ORF type:complete len:227 (+),score=51.85 TRINITY_DN41689_c0_g1_i1:53-682(+)